MDQEHVNGKESVSSSTPFYQVIILDKDPGTFFYFNVFINSNVFIHQEKKTSPIISINVYESFCHYFCKHFSDQCSGYWSAIGNFCNPLHRPHGFHYLLEKVCHRHYHLKKKKRKMLKVCVHIQTQTSLFIYCPAGYQKKKHPTFIFNP